MGSVTEPPTPRPLLWRSLTVCMYVCISVKYISNMHIKRSFLFFISVASLFLERLQIVVTVFNYLAHYMHDVQDVDEI
jgi:hypothetical protein